MNNNSNNGRGQEKVVTKGRLYEYVEWLNETNGGSYLDVSSGMTNSTYYLKITIKKKDGITGGTIHWKNMSSEIVSSNTMTINGSTEDFPRGSFWLVDNSGITHTELDNTNNYTGYEKMSFISADTKDSGSCLTYHDITGGTYTRYFDESTMTDGIIINGYSVGGSKTQYDDNQLVVEKDVNFGRFKYNLIVSSITVTVDAMNDIDEYRYGVVSNSSGVNDIPYAVVYNNNNDINYPFQDFDLFAGNVKLEHNDNPSSNAKTFRNVYIKKGNSIAKAYKDGGYYKVRINFYTDDSGYTLSSTTLSVQTGHTGETTVNFSNVKIDSKGYVQFSIRQRGEVYGYFPVNIYKYGTNDYSIDENGNVALSAMNKFVPATALPERMVLYNYAGIVRHSQGWLSDFGDNFGENGITSDKNHLSNEDVSTYNAEMLFENFPESALTEVCGKDVYNTDNTMYSRGVDVGQDEFGQTFHIAYANDAYGSLDSVSGFSGTTHLFIDKGQLQPNRPRYTCTSSYLDYTFEPFVSEYTYSGSYYRLYCKDMHSYGRTSILRRFIKKNNKYVDTSINEYEFEGKIKNGYASKGMCFPKHISGATLFMELYSGNIAMTDVWTPASGLKSGEHEVSGWTTVFEYSKTDESATSEYEPTKRDISVNGGHIVCCMNTSDDTWYEAIAPYCYMVDAETCSGATSGYGYSFATYSALTDGSGVTRYYSMDDEHYFKHFGNNQNKFTKLLSYPNYNNESVEMTINSASTRCYVSPNLEEGVVMCAPSAPLQTVNWIDSYAPYSIDYPRKEGSTIARKEVAFVDGNMAYVPSDGASGLAEYLVPSALDDNRISVITLDDVNSFSWRIPSANRTYGYYTYAGDSLYSGQTYSSHNLLESIKYGSDIEKRETELGYLTPSGATGSAEALSAFGYTAHPDFSGYSDNPLYAVPERDSGQIYGGTDFVYYIGPYAESAITSSNDTRRFLPLEVGNKIYEKGANNYDPLRPCCGDITVPYWYTTLYFCLKLTSYDENEVNPRVYLNSEEFTTSGTVISATRKISDGIYSDSGERFSVVSDSGTTIRLTLTSLSGTPTFAVHDEHVSDNLKTQPGVYAILNKNVSTTSGATGNYLNRLMSVTLFFVDVYNNREGAEFVVNVKVDNVPGILKWELNGETDYKVGAEVLNKLSQKQWGGYGINEKGYELLSCIGDLTNDNLDAAERINFGSILGNGNRIFVEGYSNNDGGGIYY